MKTASISEAKNRLSALLDLVRKGETVLITDRNRPIARLAPLDPTTRASQDSRLRELERTGVLRRARSHPGRDFLKGLPPAPKPQGDLLAALLAERNEGR